MLRQSVVFVLCLKTTVQPPFSIYGNLHYVQVYKCHDRQNIQYDTIEEINVD